MSATDHLAAHRIATAKNPDSTLEQLEVVSMDQATHPFLVENPALDLFAFEFPERALCLKYRCLYEIRERSVEPSLKNLSKMKAPELRRFSIAAAKLVLPLWEEMEISHFPKGLGLRMVTDLLDQHQKLPQEQLSWLHRVARSYLRYKIPAQSKSAVLSVAYACTRDKRSLTTRLIEQVAQTLADCTSRPGMTKSLPAARYWQEKLRLLDLWEATYREPLPELLFIVLGESHRVPIEPKASLAKAIEDCLIKSRNTSRPPEAWLARTEKGHALDRTGTMEALGLIRKNKFRFDADAVIYLSLAVGTGG